MAPGSRPGAGARGGRRAARSSCRSAAFGVVAAAALGALGGHAFRSFTSWAVPRSAWPGRPGSGAGGRAAAARRAVASDPAEIVGEARLLGCTNGTNISQLAGAIIGQLQDHGVAEISTVGAGNANSALKAVERANRMANTRTNFSGKVMAVVPAFVEVSSDQESSRWPMVLKACLIDVPAVDSEPFLVRVKEDPEKAKLLGTIIKGRVSNGSNVKLTAIGAPGVRMALKSLVKANYFLEEGGEGVVLGGIPVMEEVTLGGDTKRCMTLKVVRT